MERDFLEEQKNEKRKSVKESLKGFFTRYLTERTFYLYVAIFMISMPVGEFVSEIHDHPYVTQPVIHAFLGMIGLIMGVAWLLLNQNIRTWKMSDLFYWTLIIFAVIALACSNDIYESTAGYTYEEWFSNYMGYFALMFAATRIESYVYRKRILYIFLGLAVAESIICFFQSFGIRITDSFLDPLEHSADNLTFGLAQHMNFYGGLSVLFFGACAGMFIFCVGKKRSVILAAVTALVFYGSISTSARITWVGNSAVILFLLISLLIMCKKEKNNFSRYIKRYLILIVIMVIVVGIVLATTDKIQSELIQSAEEFTNEDTGRIGNGRFYIWKFGFEALPDNWLTGVGLDNYKWCFFNNPRFDSNTMWYNHKAHNEYIHILCTEGIPAFINYFCCLVYAIVIGVRQVLSEKNRKQAIITWIFLAMFAGYFCQAMVNSSVINTAMYFWVTIGMVMPRNTQRSVCKGERSIEGV